MATLSRCLVYRPGLVNKSDCIKIRREQLQTHPQSAYTHHIWGQQIGGFLNNVQCPCLLFYFLLSIGVMIDVVIFITYSLFTPFYSSSSGHVPLSLSSYKFRRIPLLLSLQACFKNSQILQVCMICK